MRSGHAVVWEAEPEPGLEEKADSRERGHVKLSVQDAHLVSAYVRNPEIISEAILRSFLTLFKKSDTKWQLSLSAISFFFVHFTDMIIKESYWFWYQISHFDI